MHGDGGKTKIAVLSDIHGNAVALESTLTDLAGQGIRHALVLGDLFLKGPEPDRILELLGNIHILAWVKGNTDESLAETPRGYVAQNDFETQVMLYHHYCWELLPPRVIGLIGGLDEKATFILGTKNLCCVHASTTSLRKGLSSDTPMEELESELKSVGEDIILCGHTHKPFEWWKGDRGIINCGSIGMPSDGNPESCYVVLELDPDGIKFTHRRVAYPIEELLKVALEKGFPNAEQYCAALAAGKPF